ncbi:hypothetical protein L1987_78622 [Smallanthus sonchifolius]|uniref:Uncharacterized protein n=1 Tax=Smallanthus sonchifolius TaxID=185202 RepID=A0ACB8ZDD5_9ASTR|nr:hypothetical protein L1987_78622 [Smallanthus sonchifolius]
MSSSSACCGGNCGCGSACKCQTGCGGCKMNPDMSNSETIAGLAPNKRSYEGTEMGAAASEHDGCKCGANCTCNPCTCK